MAKLKDGFYKLTASSIGSDLLVLLAGGGAKPISDFALANGTNATGTWNIDISGNAKSSTLSKYLLTGAGTECDANTLAFSDHLLRWYSSIPSTSSNLPTVTGWLNGLLALPLHSNGVTAQLYFSATKALFYRSMASDNWNQIAYTTSDITGNANTASKLQNKVKIWGLDFDGSSDVKGNLTLGYNKIYIGNGTDSFYIGWGAGNLYQYNNYYGHYFSTKSGEVMRINSSGNVGIGTTNPLRKLHVTGVIRTDSQVEAPYFMTGIGVEGLYMSAGGIAWHDTAYSYKSSLINFTSDYISLQKNTSCAGTLDVIGTGTFNSQIISNVADGTAPLVITSTSRVDNLNADAVDGFHMRQWFTNASDINNTAMFWQASGSCSDVSSMGYAALINVTGDTGRRWQIWNSRNNHQLFWRPEKSDMSDWADVHVLLDNYNFKDYVANMYWANVPISSTSNDKTTPTFANITLSGKITFTTASDGASISFVNGEKIDGYGNILLGINSASWNIFNGSRKSLITALNGGNVGIGTTSPAYKLDVNGTAKATSLMSSNIRIECDNNGVLGSRGSEINNYNGPLYLNYHSGTHIIMATGGGNVGIGTGNPAYKLDVNGTAKANKVLIYDGTNAVLSLRTTTAGEYAYLAAYNTGGQYGADVVLHSGSAMVLGAGESAASMYDNNVDSLRGSENLYLTADGAVKVFTNCDTIGNRKHAATFDTAGAVTLGEKVSARKATWLKLTTPGHTGSSAWCVGIDDTSDNSYLYMKYNESDTSYFYVRHDGCAFAPHFYESSDQRLKTNIQAILNKDNIPQIKEFDWKESGEHSYGLIAQELEEQGYSELVSTKDDGYKTVNYSAALSLIVGKLQVKIKELEKEIEILKNKN